VRVERLDQRHVVRERVGASFVVLVYEGGDHADAAWSVGAHLLTDTDLPSVLAWLADALPPGCCWSLGVVRAATGPTSVHGLDVSWIVGADVLSTAPQRRSAQEQQLAAEMLARRHHVPSF
jgi:hypothetical protein